MRILFLTQVLPYPLDAGPKIRAYYVLRHLAQTHDVTLVSFVRPTDTPAAVAHLEQYCRAVHTLPMPRSRVRDGLHLAWSLVAKQPFIIARDRVSAMTGLIRTLAQHQGGFDVVHADQLWMAAYALGAPRTGGKDPGPKTVLDQHNAVHMIPQRMASAESNPLKRWLLELEARKMACYEVETCRRFDRVIWVTSEDYQAVQLQSAISNFLTGDPTVIPICGDPEQVSAVVRRSGARRITFLGGLHWPPNAQGVSWFVRQVLPQVIKRVPDAVFTLIGKDPPRELLDTGLAVPRANLDVTGYVADPRPYLEETAVFVVPLLAGGGMRVKIVDAWTWGMPIVSTTIGAEGIEIEPGTNMLVADMPQAFAEAVIRLLLDSQEQNRLAEAGRHWVVRRYNWRTVYQLWDRVYEGLLAGNSIEEAA